MNTNYHNVENNCGVSSLYLVFAPPEITYATSVLSLYLQIVRT